MNIVQTIQQISLQADETAKLEALEQLKDRLPQLRAAGKTRYLIALLYDENWYVRQESAFIIEQLGVKLKGEDYYRYLLALQDFNNLFMMFDDPFVRTTLFGALKDANHRLRRKIFSYLKYEDCTTWEEKALFWYGQAAYNQLTQLATETEEARDFIVQLLRYGMEKNHNPDYHRRRCAEALQTIERSEHLEEFVRELLAGQKRTEKRPANHDARPVPLVDEEPDLLFRLQTVIADLKVNGLWVNGHLIFPDIQIGSATNRITYRNPGLQTWPKEQREKQIQPPPGQRLFAFDFNCIEPRLVLHFLLQKLLIALDEVPQDDIYLAFYPQDRSKAKRFLNALINGGSVPEEYLQTPFAQKVARGLKALRLEQMSLARHRGFVETLAGNRIKLEPEVANFGGKAVNRLIQGSASDVFNHALCALHETIHSEGWPAQIYFVLFDEVWLALPHKEFERYLSAAESLLNRIYKDFNLLTPLPCRMRRLAVGGE
ncbi:DNA polymerase [Caldithrix abyssi]